MNKKQRHTNCTICTSVIDPTIRGYYTKFCTNDCKSKFLRRKQKIIFCCICNKEMPISKLTRANKTTCSLECKAKFISTKYKGRRLTNEWKHNQNISKTRDKIRVEGTFKCDRCLKDFVSNTSLRAHKARCGHDIVIKCDCCNNVYRSKSAYGLHLAYNNGILKKKTSKQETEFGEKLKLIFPDVVHKFFIDKCNHEYDFFIPSKNLIIEFDGDYWHGNKNTMLVLNDRQKRQFKIDESWMKRAINEGYEIVRVWASDAETFLRKYEN